MLRPVRQRRRPSVVRGAERVGLAGVLADLDRVAVPAEVPGEAAVEGLAWEPRDVEDRRWWPQGVASVDGDDVLLASWYAERDRLRPGEPGRPTHERPTVAGGGARAGGGHTGGG